MPSQYGISGRRELVGPASLDAAARTSDLLWLAVIVRPLDFEPYGLRKRDGDDCSCGCRYFLPLDGELRLDWGVCANVRSHRCGLLTWEHMGCPQFEARPPEERRGHDH
jgi:hypothetical protein